MLKAKYQKRDFSTERGKMGQVDTNTLRYDKNHVTWKDKDGNDYCYETNNIYWAVARGENEILIAKKNEEITDYMVLLSDGREYLSYTRRCKDVSLKDEDTVCLSFQSSIEDLIVDNNGNIYLVTGSDIYFYRKKKKLLEKICEIPEEYYFQRIEELGNKYLSIICVPEHREKYGFRDCRLGMELSNKKLVDLGIAY